MGVDDVKVDGSLIGWRVSGAGEQVASRSGMRFRRQEVSTSSWTSWVRWEWRAGIRRRSRGDARRTRPVFGGRTAERPSSVAQRVQ